MSGVTTTPESAAVLDVHDHIALITLNRPQAMNAVNSALATAVGEALERAAEDEQVRAVVVTGSGRAFCAGADLKEVAQRRAIHATGHPEWGFAGLTRHWIDKPVIAAVNGFAMGGGTEIALACDLAVAAESATFGLPEVKRGLLAAAGGVVRLQRQVPMKVALELSLTGDAFSAGDALRWGLVNRVVPDDQVVEVALGLAGRIAANAPLSVRYTKHSVHRTHGGADWGADWEVVDPWSVSDRAAETVFASEDAVEGAQAFAEKRNPVWRGL